MPSTRRPTTRTTSSVAWSAQCTSSSTSTRGHPQRVDEGPGDATRLGPRVETGREVAAELLGHVEQRAERRRRREALAGAVRHASVRRRRERAHERGLPDPGLAADEDEPAAVGAERVEPGEQVLAFEEGGHAAIVRIRCPGFNRGH